MCGRTPCDQESRIGLQLHEIESDRRANERGYVFLPGLGRGQSDEPEQSDPRDEAGRRRESRDENGREASQGRFEGLRSLISRPEESTTKIHDQKPRETKG